MKNRQAGEAAALNEPGKRVGELQQQVEDLGRDRMVGVGVFLTYLAFGCIIVARCVVEQRQLVGLITRRSQVRILSPLPKHYSRSSGQGIFGSLTIFGSWSLTKRRFSDEP